MAPAEHARIQSRVARRACNGLPPRVRARSGGRLIQYRGVFGLAIVRFAELPLRILRAPAQFFNLGDQLSRLPTALRSALEQFVDILPLPPQLGGNYMQLSHFSMARRCK